MKRLKKGVDPKKRKWKGTCRKCKAEFEAEEQEMKHITSDSQEDARFSWEQCPDCKAGRRDEGFGGVLFYEQDSR